MKGAGCIFSKGCTDIIDCVTSPDFNNILRTIFVVCNKSPLDPQNQLKNKYRPFIKFIYDKATNLTTNQEKVEYMNNYINKINVNSMSSIQEICMYNFIISEKIKEKVQVSYPFRIDANEIIFYYDDSCIKSNQSKNTQNKKNFLIVRRLLPLPTLSTTVDKKVPSACNFDKYNNMTKKTSKKLCIFVEQKKETSSLIQKYTSYSSTLNKNTLLGFITKDYQLYFKKSYNTYSIAQFNMEFLKMFKTWHSFPKKGGLIAKLPMLPITSKKQPGLSKLPPINKAQASTPVAQQAQKSQVAQVALLAPVQVALQKQQEQQTQQAQQASLAATQASQAPQTKKIQQAQQVLLQAPVQVALQQQQAPLQAPQALQVQQALQAIQALQAPQTKKNQNTLKSIKLYSGGPVLFERHGYPITSKEGENIYLLTLLSTTTCYDIALGFSKSCIYIITVPDELVEVLIPVEDCTMIKDEYEIILPIGSILQVTKVAYKDDKYTIEATLQPYNMEIIDRFINIFTIYSSSSGGGSNSENLSKKRRELKNNDLGFISDEDKLNLLFTDLVEDYLNLLNNNRVINYYNKINNDLKNELISYSQKHPVIYFKYTEFDIGLIPIEPTLKIVDSEKNEIADTLNKMFYSKDQTQVDKIKEFKYKQWYIYKKQQNNNDLVSELKKVAEELRNEFDGKCNKINQLKFNQLTKNNSKI